jgi:hypothetical protein
MILSLKMNINRYTGFSNPTSVSWDLVARALVARALVTVPFYDRRVSSKYGFSITKK